jgi:dTDP-4-dehydrorhamnose 3,5-epimerase
MEFEAQAIPDIVLIKPRVHADSRGFFLETYHKRAFAEHGLAADFVQDNHSRSRRGALRGLHYQIRQPQGKLIRVVRGEIFDVSVDLRKRSATFGRWAAFNLSEENRLQVWVPPGFAHGFYVLSDEADVIYKTTEFYAPEWERTLLWNDPEIGIAWPVEAGREPVVSAKDDLGKRLREAEVYE